MSNNTALLFSALAFSLSLHQIGKEARQRYYDAPGNIIRASQEYIHRSNHDYDRKAIEDLKVRMEKVEDKLSSQQ